MGWDAGKPSNAGTPNGEISQLRDNWAYLETFGNVNHRFTGANTDGYHTIVDMPENSSADATVNLDGVVYVKDVSGVNELFYRNSGSVIQLTRGGSPGGGADAYCVFNGTQATPITPSNSFNVTDVTKSGGGLYVVNFTKNFTDANYVAVITFFQSAQRIAFISSMTKAAGSLTFQCASHAPSGTASSFSPNDVNVAVFRNS